MIRIVFIYKFLHFTPLKNHSTLDSTSHMSSDCAVFIITLNTTSFFSIQAMMASNIKSFKIQLPFNLIFKLIYKVNFWSPINAYQMSEYILLFINAFHSTFYISTKKTFNIRTSIIMILVESDASITEPISLWNFVNDISPIAALMNCYITK